MKIIVNGKEKTVADRISLDQLIASVCENPEYVIAEVNEDIVKSHLWGKTPLKDKDTIELVTFVGGG